MSLQDSIRCKPMRIKTMDGKVIRVPVDEVLSPGSVKVFNGCGMPIEDTNGQRGNLYIKVDIKFPNHLSKETKDKINEIFDAVDQELQEEEDDY